MRDDSSLEHWWGKRAPNAQCAALHTPSYLRGLLPIGSAPVGSSRLPGELAAMDVYTSWWHARVKTLCVSPNTISAERITHMAAFLRVCIVSNSNSNCSFIISVGKGQHAMGLCTLLAMQMLPRYRLPVWRRGTYCLYALGL